ncbi:MAG: NAD-dependent epimerase/dehydratase family protein [Fimbriimonadaceae bacterium]
MRILALGGTQFVGRAFVDAALSHGHHVTVLHRGKTPLPAGWSVDEILTDRDGGLSAVGDRAWDAVYDSCGYAPRVVRASAEALVTRCERYLFISTISVFDMQLNLVRAARPLETEEVTGDSYGPLKVECEDAVAAAFGERSLIVRPGLVAGPHDPTGRFCYWVNRFATYGDVLVPDTPEAPLQQIDVRDLGAFCLKLLEEGRSGTFHVTGEPSSFSAMIDVCAALGGGEAIRVPVDAIEALGVRVGVDLPLVWPADAAKLFGFDSAESLACGLVRRPLRETAADTLAWLLALPGDRPIGKFERSREVALLAQVLA